ncbi:hypothetical protein M1D72_03430 [Vibrio sp. AK197]
MSISSIPAGYSILEQSNKMAESAARDIQQIASTSPSSKDSESLTVTAPEQDAAQDKKPSMTSSYTDPLIELSQASQYSRVGTNVMQRDQEMLGSLLDIHI